MVRRGRPQSTKFAVVGAPPPAACSPACRVSNVPCKFRQSASTLLFVVGSDARHGRGLRSTHIRVSFLARSLNSLDCICSWTADLNLPKTVWLPGLFNPQSFLTAVMQTTARSHGWPLDKTVLVTEITKKQPDQISAPAKDGAFIHG